MASVAFAEGGMTKDLEEMPKSGADVRNPDGSSSVVLVCEHASNFIPLSFAGLGLTEKASKSHAAWDPGALAVSDHVSDGLNAVRVAGTVSRLVYDCNRPPEAIDAMPAKSELIEIPGNVGLRNDERAARVGAYYEPFHACLSKAIATKQNPVLVTVHSFTPIYHGQKRIVEIGILHDSDARLADAMLQIASRHTKHDVQRNAPYGPEHGVTHTLQKHAVSAGHRNVMIEIRNDLIVTSSQQIAMADMITGWIDAAL